MSMHRAATLSGVQCKHPVKRTNREFTVSGPNVSWVLSDLTYMVTCRQLAEAATVIGAYTQRIVGLAGVELNALPTDPSRALHSAGTENAGKRLGRVSAPSNRTKPIPWRGVQAVEFPMVERAQLPEVVLRARACGSGTDRGTPLPIKA